MRERAGREAHERRGAVLALIAWIGLGAGCSSEGPPVIVQLPAIGGQGGPTFDVRRCQHYAAFELIERHALQGPDDSLRAVQPSVLYDAASRVRGNCRDRRWPRAGAAATTSLNGPKRTGRGTRVSAQCKSRRKADESTLT